MFTWITGKMSFCIFNKYVTLERMPNLQWLIVTTANIDVRSYQLTLISTFKFQILEIVFTSMASWSSCLYVFYLLMAIYL